MSENANRTGVDVQTRDEEAISEAQAMMMAYLDGELTAADRARFETMLADDPDLRRELDRFRGLLDLTDTITLPEPSDHEIRRFWAGFYNRGEWQIGWILFLGGLSILAACGLWFAMTRPWLPWLAKIAIAATLTGLAMLLASTIRLRQRVARYDRYRGVLR
jgi:ferric-dicitrate binding protein FerR (iron transport regulator)